jgi:ABC-type glutathione transport system ATPase component
MLLCVDDIWLSYRGRQVLRGVSFSLNNGEMVGLVGASGSGKTSLALAILGLLPATASVRGTILYEGQDLLTATARRLRHLRGRSIAWIFQEPHASLNPVMRVRDQVGEAIRAHRDIPRAQLRAEAELALVKTGLEDPALHRSYPHELSGGQAQRVLIAQALVHRPSLLIADEPTGSLDTITQAEVMKLFRKLTAESGTALLFITHQPSLLEGFASQKLDLRQGRLQAA